MLRGNVFLFASLILLVCVYIFANDQSRTRLQATVGIATSPSSGNGSISVLRSVKPSLSAFLNKTLSISKGIWSRQAPWIWKDGAQTYDTSVLQHLDIPTGLTVGMYGSSYMREIYFDMLRLVRNQSASGKIDEDERWIPSGDPARYGSTARCRKGAQHGANMKDCGPPGFRINPPKCTGSKWPFVNHTSKSYMCMADIFKGTLVYGFKTYMFTPDADELFLKRLVDSGVRHPDVILVGIGIWGCRCGRENTKKTVPATEKKSI